MVSGYKIFWTDHALIELSSTYEYLKKNFTEKEIKKLSIALDSNLKLISNNPRLFQKSNKMGIRKIVILKYNSMFYKVEKDKVVIISFFSNRQNPSKNKFIV